MMQNILISGMKRESKSLTKTWDQHFEKYQKHEGQPAPGRNGKEHIHSIYMLYLECQLRNNLLF